jgi:hypothetical protein
MGASRGRGKKRVASTRSYKSRGNNWRSCDHEKNRYGDFTGTTFPSAAPYWGQSVRLAAARFVFKKHSPLDPDPKWSRELRTGLFHLCFFSPPTQVHDWRDIYLRSGETTNIWIGVNPRHSDYEIEQAHAAKRIGRLYFQMTRWTESGSPKARWVRVKL